MKKLFITKDNLKILTKNLKKECDEFIAPKKEHLDDIIFGDAKNDGSGLLDYEGNSVISPRAFLLPQTEPLLRIKSAKGGEFVPIEEKKKRVFYGVRPCDIKALALMRKFFVDEFVDVPYQQKLENSFFIVLACAKPCLEKSFCAQMRSGPIAQEGFDLQLLPLSRGYLVESGTKKGSQLLKKNKRLFRRALAADEKELKARLKDFSQDIEKIDYRKLSCLIKEDKIPQSVWEDLGLRCVSCSGCITLCPTCSCFSVIDRMDGDGGVRLRYTDGCPYAGFTRMAGGHSPLPLHKEHIRRFFEHKLNIDVQRYGEPSCVGCARCMRTCPGNISIKKFIDEALKR